MSSYIEELIKKIQEYESHVDTALVTKAYEFARNAHEGQKRRSGEEYIIHPMEVAMLLTEVEMDSRAICAALLHDVVEDTQYSSEEIEKEFGSEIALLVEGVTKLSKLNFETRKEAQAENLRKMLLAMAKDLRVIIIKLADRLHNMRTLEFQAADRQKDIARETMEIYAPLAHRIGVFHFKWELEDLSFRYLQPQIFNEIAVRLKSRRQEREEYVYHLIKTIRIELEKSGIQADIAGRPKNIYSIYKKMLKQQKGLDEIYDKIAIRIILNDKETATGECYGVLGIIHTMWRPIPGRFKDYISNPKPNGYQSLHTTLIGIDGEPFEVQIRTREMHRVSEYGIAAHWKYKEGRANVQGNKFDEKLSWLRSILEWQQNVKDTDEFMESLKLDLFDDSIFIFTPKGDIYEFPKGSCPVDVAYRIHTEVGNHCSGAKVNGKIVPLESELSTGDIVNIMTAKNQAGPSFGWLSFVRTTTAKSRIKQWFNREKREETLAKGMHALERGLKKSPLKVREMMKDPILEDIAHKMSFRTVDDMLLAIAESVLSVGSVVNKMIEVYHPELQEEEAGATLLENVSLAEEHHISNQTGALKIRDGVDNVSIRLARCCNPLPGDAVKGYITRGRGVSVHRLDCPNMQNYIRREADRLIEVEWLHNRGSYVVALDVEAFDRNHLTIDVMNVISDFRLNLLSIYSRAVREGKAIISMRLELKTMDQLELVIKRIEAVPDILEVRRL